MSHGEGRAEAMISDFNVLFFVASRLRVKPTPLICLTEFRSVPLLPCDTGSSMSRPWSTIEVLGWMLVHRVGIVGLIIFAASAPCWSVQRHSALSRRLIGCETLG